MYISEIVNLPKNPIIFFPANKNNSGLIETAGFSCNFDKDADFEAGKSSKKESNDEKKCGIRGLRVLIVEDNMVNQKVLELMLKKEGVGVCIAENGLEGIKVLKENEFDIVFMDIQMPVMDGLTATGKIRNGEAGELNKNIPIIAVTAHTSSVEESNCLEVGMNDFMTKPVSQDVLKSMVKKYCN